MFGKSELKCSGCGKQITNEEELIAFVKLPKAYVMPYGAFDVALAKCATGIYCKYCHIKE
ncbi:hypothetical protein [Ectobacillus panaciterrae]|uniref:hypothetical protein n=1 Tax=Ectobacillus panaciterrae TaxID=363872 RepID=UPI0004256E87|nr:hypothetical protein [Ectobacillus panaciterrae]